MLSPNTIVLGLTGAFGSGCTTLANGLRLSEGFHHIKLSDLIHDDWTYRRRTLDLPEDLPVRGDLQDLGDARRYFHEELHYWVRTAVEQAENHPTVFDGLVLDGIRNPGEVHFLRENFHTFGLIAVDAPWDERWVRSKDAPAWSGRSRSEFDRISRRDIDSPDPWGQKVQACVDLSDFVITNDQHEPLPRAESHLLNAATRFVKLLREPSPDEQTRPREDETFMHMAHASASRSACLKRQVGAIIVRRHADGPNRPATASSSLARVISVGYNENPDGMQPCFEEYKACYRDLWRKDRLEEMALSNCPACGGPLAKVDYPPRCSDPDCIPGRDLLSILFPGRAMSHCTALHAEVRAILAAGGRDIRGTTIYSTTFPCFQCAQQIIHADISELVYVEAYPDRAAEELLVNAGVSIQRFNGVRSTAYTRLFGGWRERAEETYTIGRS